MFAWVRELVWKLIKPMVDLYVTDQIVKFHRALVTRGQIKPPSRGSIGYESSIADYKEDHKHQ
jgi:hypothetical protein